MTIFEFENGDDDYKSLSKTIQCVISMAVSAVFSFFFVLLIQLPLIAAPAVILGFPIFMLEPHLGITMDYTGTGKADIEIIFFIVILKTPLAWGIFYAYYFIIFNLLALFFPYTFWKLIKKKYLTASVLLLTSIMTWYRFSWYYMGDKGFW